jgi:phosphopentomutase
VGKDSTTGHWEIAGVISETPFPVYPMGFPQEIIKSFEMATGREILGNKAASGTEILKELGDDHVATSRPIVYTSADSVFQIAAHEDVISLNELYEMCEIARGLLTGQNKVSRVIARPFTGKSGSFRRSRHRKDFSVAAPSDTILDVAMAQGLSTIGIGKTGDLFAHRGLSLKVDTEDNQEGILATLIQINEAPEGIIFTNLVDTDTIYGHRRDVAGFRKALEEFDQFLPKLMQAMQPDDLLFITADHGVDPTMPGSDHTREFTPLLVYGRNWEGGIDLGTRETFADIAATVREFLEISGTGDGSGKTAGLAGTSFLGQMKRVAAPKMRLHSDERQVD